MRRLPNVSKLKHSDLFLKSFLLSSDRPSRNELRTCAENSEPGTAAWPVRCAQCGVRIAAHGCALCAVRAEIW